MTLQVMRAIAPVLLLGVLLAPGTPAMADEYSVLAASPIGGHSGDTIYLAGSGLEPHHRFPYVLMACPNWAEMEQYNNGVEHAPGPTTDARGQFKGFPFQVPALRHFRSLGCQIYVKDGVNPYGPTFPGTYTILSSDSKPPTCWKQICVTVNALPKRVRAGLVERVEVRSRPTAWPGAAVDIAVSFPGGKTVHRRVALDFNGIARIQLRVDGRAPQPVQVRIRARAQLGSWGGNGLGSFTMVG